LGLILTMTTAESKARTTIAGRWQANCDARMNWAFDAYQRLLESLSSDVSSRMSSAHPEAYVVVFGRTQVGKTTLLLELMGVHGPSVDRVSSVLRGGRGKGQSATATVMEYSRSADTSWALQIPNQPPQRYTDDVGARAALGALREQMESRQLRLDGPVRLDIPCDCFVPVEDGHSRVRMLDLPGDQASNPVEQRHVELVAERYVAGADLILLVGKMDDLSFLKPGGLFLPGIEDWQIVPERFRIITTYSFTAGSVQAAVRRGLKIEKVRMRLLEQLETFGHLSSNARRTDLLFPLEFGQSLERTAQHDPELVAQIDPVVDELKRELVHQINNATTPMSRLRMSLRSHLTVAKVKEKKLQEMDEELKPLERSLISARDDLEKAKSIHAYNAKRYDSLKAKREQLARNSPANSVSDICALDESEWIDTISKMRFSNKSVKALQGGLVKFRAWLRESYLAINAQKVSSASEMEWFWRDVHPEHVDDLPAVQRLLAEHLSSVESRLHEYLTDGYWFDSNFKNDVTAVQGAMRKAAAACRELASRHWCSAIERQLKDIQQILQDAERDVSLSNRLARELEAKVAVADDAVRKFKAQRDDFETRMAADQERCRAFTGMLDDCYAQQLASMVNRLRSNIEPAFALVDLISTVHLIETRSKLLATGLPAASHLDYAH
jgi:microcompartment protein CcmL/EutN